MLGLIFILVIALYLVSVVLVGWVGAWLANRFGMSVRLGAVLGMLAILLPVFGDWIPMEVMFKYDCSRYAGYTQYKTLDQWKSENPGVAETLVPSNDLHSTHEGDTERYTLNQRFAWDIVRPPHWFHIRERDERIVDTQNGEVLARHIDFDTDIPPIGLGIRRPGAYKIWMMKDSCEAGDIRINQVQFNGYFTDVKRLGRKSDGT